MMKTILKHSLVITVLFFKFPIAFAEDLAKPPIAASKDLSGAAATNATVGGGLATQCKTNQLACIMAGLSFAQAASSLFAGKSSNAAGKAAMTNSSLYPSTDFGGYTGADIDKQIAFAESQLAAGKATLKKNAPNIDLDKGVVNTKKGAVGLGTLSSGKAMLDAGLIDPSQVADADAALKKMNSMSMPSTAVASGGGGYSPPAKSQQFTMPEYQMPRMPAEAPSAPVSAGLVKLANGEPIGTASDNIFNMLHNRYQIKVKEKIFVGQEGLPSSSN